MQRRWMVAALCFVLVAGACLAGGCSSQPEDTQTDVPKLEIPIEDIPITAEESGSTRSTVVYYADAAGYLVPVTRTIPWEEGIAKATLSLMVKNEENDYEAAALGLHNVLPEATSVDIDILPSKLAKVSLSNEANSCYSALDEANMVYAVVCALTEFDSIESVQLLINGHAVQTLKHGTDISEPFTRGDINIESVSTAAGVADTNKVKLYFESAESGAMVPVTRLVFSNQDIETAVLELLKGPKKDSGLLNTLPADAAILSVSKKDGIVIINFTEEFAKIANETDGGRNAIKSLMLTCSQFEDVKQVKLKVNGKDWTPEKATLAMPTFVNSETEDIYNFLFD